MTWRRVGVLPGARLTGRGRAAGLLPALATLVFWGLATLPQGTGSTPTDGYGDVDLYREIAAGVAAGGNYYTVAIQTQLAHDFPTSPFTAVRLPTMTFVQNAFGEGGASLLLIALTAVALLAMTVWMRSAGVLRAELLASVLILGANLAHSAVDGLSWFHDAWAGVLIVLAIALRTSKAWWLAAAVGFSAVCFRELALPFLLVMVVIAWPRRREAVAWGARSWPSPVSTSCTPSPWPQRSRPSRCSRTAGSTSAGGSSSSGVRGVHRVLPCGRPLRQRVLGAAVHRTPAHRPRLRSPRTRDLGADGDRRSGRGLTRLPTCPHRHYSVG